MNRAATIEAVPLVNRLCNNLRAIIVDTGSAGVAARSALGQVSANATVLCANDEIGAALDQCFDLVRQAGCTIAQMESVRIAVAGEITRNLGATLVRDCSIQLALAQEGKIISAMTFASRQDVDAMIASIAPVFGPAIETAADTMDPMVFRALIQLQAAVVNHLVVTARPLPEMLTYQFAAALPSLIISQRLYGDASRYDEIRNENKVVHPAFCPPIGQALAT
jgi:prophage DNA circulation protein